MMRGFIWMLCIAVSTALTSSATVAQEHDHHRHAQPYAGQQARAISTLTEQELQGFLDGRGMGLARPAEVNGFPGPMHVIELSGPLQLSEDQLHRVRAVYERMKAKATELGKQYVNAERAVDAAFKAKGGDAGEVAARVAEASRLLAEIRLAHLNAHIEITPLLTPGQLARYADLRGYRDTPRQQHHNKP